MVLVIRQPVNGTLLYRISSWKFFNKVYLAKSFFMNFQAGTRDESFRSSVLRCHRQVVQGLDRQGPEDRRGVEVQHPHFV